MLFKYIKLNFEVVNLT